MFCFTINGNRITTDQAGSMLTFLREELRLTSVKDGCSQGACGTCMILVEGEAVRACRLTTEKADGKSLLTVEGFSPRERDIYSYAFAATGAIQCGFCTPGMIISAKALLDKTPDPTPEQIRRAINGNICRCTGYTKIVEAVLLAAQLKSSNGAIPTVQFTGRLGESLLRVDACAKALGEAEYAGDLRFEGMLYGGALRSAHPRAEVLSIDTTAALALAGVRAVLTAEQLPGVKKVGHIRQDYDILIGVGETTRFLGDALALIAADSPTILEHAKQLIQVTYRPLNGVFSPQEARAADAPLLHPTGNLLTRELLRRGEVEKALAASAHQVTKTYDTPPTEHAFLEPEAAVALPDGHGGILIHSGDQGIYQTRHECALALGLPEEKVRVIAATVGGGFGGKEDMSVQHHAALLAQATDMPVRVVFSRAESMLVHPKRHSFTIEITTGCDAQGRLTALQAHLIADTGAYASLGGPVLQRACTHAAGPYKIEAVEIIGEAYYTNNPPAGAFRGFGVAQSCFATECNLNLLAEAVGISPWEIRFRNAVRPGDTLPNGQLADASTALVETLLAVQPYYEKHPKAGLACALKNSGLGVGIPDVGRCRLQVQGGKVQIHSSAACIGQGLGTVLTQMVCAQTGLSPKQVVYSQPDTQTAPDAGNTTASRQTLFTGEATCQAALALRSALESATLVALEGQSFFGEYSSQTDRMGSEKPNPVSHVAYSYATHLVDLDADGRVCKVIAAHDVGRAINPVSLTGQIEGGVAMSLGFALTEDFPLEQGRPTAKFGTLGLLRATQVPEIEAIIIEKPQDGPAAGAKGVGEICSIPTAPAVQLAYYQRDGIFRQSLPLKNTAYKKS